MPQKGAEGAKMGMGRRFPQSSRSAQSFLSFQILCVLSGEMDVKFRPQWERDGHGRRQIALIGIVGGWWLVVGRVKGFASRDWIVGGCWLVVGGWWLVVGGWWLVVGGCPRKILASRGWWLLGLAIWSAVLRTALDGVMRRLGLPLQNF